MVRRAARALALLLVLLMVTVPVASLASQAWGNGSSTSVEFTDFGIHDITCDIALRTATYTSPEFLTWMTDWYIRNETDYVYSFDGDNDLSGPTDTDNINAYTDDPDSSLQDWDNHTLYLHPRTGWDPPDGDTARRVSQLYNQTVYHIYRWLMNGSVRYDRDQHYAAYYGGLISHYIMDLTQFGHTDWTRLDHSNPPDFDPQGATYHSYYEARTWTDQALRTIHVDLMGYALPEPLRVLDPAQTVRDLAGFVNGRHGPDVQFEDIDQSMVTLGSTYALMLENFTSNWDAGVTYNSAQGFDEDLWNLTEENLVVGMNNLTNLWTSAYLDARDRFLEDAADIVVELIGLYPNGTIFEGQNVAVSFDVYNRGKVRTPSFQVSGYLDGVDEIGKAFLELVPGQHETVSFWFFPSAGDHSLSLVGDATQGTPESNESNNIVTVDFYVEAEHHESKLSSEHTVIEILQEDTGWFDLTLENLGNRGDVFDISVDAYPGTIDFSLTLPVEKVHVPALSNRTFRIDVTTILDNPVGSRYFVVTATGENSSVAIRLTVLIKERQLAPFIEVEYAFFTNISLPISFDASGSWDHNGDEISFDWDFGDGTFGTGAVIEHAWQEEGVYVIILNASDGQLRRERTLEVSVEDAIPPVSQLTVTEVDFNAARFEWTTWESTRYFEEYRLYIADVPDPGDIISDANLFQTIELFYVDNATLRVPPEDILFVVLVTVNINGDEYRSNVAEVVLELRTKTYQEPGLLYAAEVFASSDMLSTIELKWREWQPLLVESSNNYVPNLISTKQVDGGQPTTGSVEIGQGVPGYLFAD
ncbi:MAG: PKD domain-containing protein, partial [Planctomycetes bacterium]|nr:PKD domain-containing protein [Planctomycetota bacterium]